MAELHEFPQGYQSTDWVVPINDGRAVIRHGHESEDDHSACGPTLFCCSRSARLYVNAFPETPEATGQWQLLNGKNIVRWLDAGVNVVYFVCCDSNDPSVLRAIGVTIEAGARDLVLKNTHMTSLEGEAEALAVAPKNDVLFQLLQDREESS